MPNDQTKQYSTDTQINHDFSHDKSHGYYTFRNRMKIFIIVIITAIASCWITGAIKDVERLSKESIYYSDVTHRLKQSTSSIHADMKAGEIERMKEKIELLNVAMESMPMNRDGVSLHHLSEAFYQLDHPQAQGSEPVR